MSNIRTKAFLMTEGANVLEAKQITKCYTVEQSTPVFSELSFSIAQGESVALMGASGSGKSTLLHLLGGMDAVTSGGIWFETMALHEASEDSLSLYRRDSLGFVFQQFNLLPTLSVQDNILFPRRLLNMSDQDPNLAGMLDKLELNPLLERWPDELSGGQQQRVAIARALAHNPKLILADEPTGNLDDQMSRKVLSLLVELCQASGCALIMATHSKEMAGYLSRCLTLKDGKLHGPGC